MGFYPDPYSGRLMSHSMKAHHIYTDLKRTQVLKQDYVRQPGSTPGMADQGN